MILKTMEILDALQEFALQKYPLGIECFHNAYELNERFLELTTVIKEQRKKLSSEEVCKQLSKSFKDCYFRDTTYLYNSNPSIRIEFFYNKKPGKILICLLYPIFTIIGEFKEEANKVKAVLDDYTFIDDLDLKKINPNTISANQKFIKDTTLFDCFFHDN